METTNKTKKTDWLGVGMLIVILLMAVSAIWVGRNYGVPAEPEAKAPVYVTVEPPADVVTELPAIEQGTLMSEEELDFRAQPPLLPVDYGFDEAREASHRDDPPKSPLQPDDA